MALVRDIAHVDVIVVQTLNDYGLCVKMAKRYNLPGAGNIFKEQFARLMGSQRYQDAMELVASSPQGVLRTLDTINEFKKLPTAQGQTSPLLQYFSMLLKKPGVSAPVLAVSVVFLP